METAIKIPFGKFDRDPEVKTTPVDLQIIEAVKQIKASTPHEVTYELTKRDEETGFFRRVPRYRITKLELEIKEPITINLCNSIFQK